MDSENESRSQGGVLAMVESQVVDDHDYPERGVKAWMVVVGAWCAMIPPMGLLNTLAVLQAWFSENELKGTPESTTGWIFSTYAFLITACGAQVGQCIPFLYGLKLKLIAPRFQDLYLTPTISKYYLSLDQLA